LAHKQLALAHPAAHPNNSILLQLLRLEIGRPNF
jgi:hypothetical protein